MESEKRRWTSLLSLDVAAAALRHRGTTSRPLMMRLDRGDVVVCGDPCCAYSPLSWLAAIGMGRYGAQFLARSYDWHARSAADILELLQQRAARAHMLAAIQREAAPPPGEYDPTGPGGYLPGGRSLFDPAQYTARIGPANAALKAEEDRLRGLFVAPGTTRPGRPHALLVPLYPPGCKPHQVEAPEEHRLSPGSTPRGGGGPKADSGGASTLWDSHDQ
ncbi:hypothetical protein PAPYR_13401 [Paratrimastix pyriformis]|uniref:Uncharacterized protein n=1 Tax=Paratrimastix pyriformis TaxID=342808 RepID=A0ABQ8U0C3_9EUKA|nr:hypothetical protein PAPYR_13401 [Paratrimastix pyriformis]